MFHSATSFNQPLNDWIVSNVTDMRWMFDGASSFNQPLNDWNVSNVRDARYMFDGTTAYAHWYEQLLMRFYSDPIDYDY